MAPPVLIRATFVSNDAQRPLQALLPEASTVGALKAAFLKQLPSIDAIRVVFKGEELNSDDASLADIALLPTKERPIPHVYVCRKAALPPGLVTASAPQERPAPAADTNTSSSSSGGGGGGGLLSTVSAAVADATTAAGNAVAAATAPPRQPGAAAPAAAEAPRATPAEPPTCRLCFDTAETSETGKLFSPCLCAGTMKHIHVQCLNNWRMRSQNEASYYRCDQCGYEYNITRANWASYLLDRRVVTAAAVLCLVLGTLVCGSIISAAAPIPLHEYIWDYTAFNPLAFVATKVCATEDCNVRCNTWNLWTWQEACAGCRCALAPTDSQAAALAVVTTGLAPVAAYGLYTRRHHIVDHWMHAATLACAIISAPRAYGRFLLVLGVVASYYLLLQATALRAKAVMTRWGEHIMKVKND